MMIISAGCYDYAGMQLIRLKGGMARTMIDVCKVFSIWIVCISLGFEEFKFL